MLTRYAWMQITGSVAEVAIGAYLRGYKVRIYGQKEPGEPYLEYPRCAQPIHAIHVPMESIICSSGLSARIGHADRWDTRTGLRGAFCLEIGTQLTAAITTSTAQKSSRWAAGQLGGMARPHH